MANRMTETLGQLFTLTPDVLDALQQLSWDASDLLGQTVSTSLIIQALIHQVVMRGSWATDTLLLTVAEELKHKMT